MICQLFSATVQNKAVEEISKISERPPKSPSSSHPVTTEDDRFGNKKARSSFGRGFFKIKGGKRTASTPNLGKRWMAWCGWMSSGSQVEALW